MSAVTKNLRVFLLICLFLGENFAQSVNSKVTIKENKTTIEQITTSNVKETKPTQPSTLSTNNNTEQTKATVESIRSTVTSDVSKTTTQIQKSKVAPVLKKQESTKEPLNVFDMNSKDKVSNAKPISAQKPNVSKEDNTKKDDIRRINARRFLRRKQSNRPVTTSKPITPEAEENTETLTKKQEQKVSGRNIKSENSVPKSQNVEPTKATTENTITTSSTTEASVTDIPETATTWDGLPCSSRFRAHPVDKTKFELAFSENVFEKIYQSCPNSLVWRQDQCRCGWPEPEVVEQCSCCDQGLNAHGTDTFMYLRLVNGKWLEETCHTFDTNQIWDNEKCTCVWDPKKPQSHKAPVFKGAVLPKLMTKCMNLVNMTLDEGLKDADGRDLTPLFGKQRIRIVDEKGNVGKSIEIRRAPFKIGIFNGNDLQSTVYFKFNFKVHPDQIRRRRKMILISNGCKRRWQRKTIEPSLEVSFFPYNETFEVQFSTTGKRVVEYIVGNKNENGWYQCVLYLQDRILNLEVNGKKVYSTNGMSGRVKSTDCPLTVAGSPDDAKLHFDGYLDELRFVKQCKYVPTDAS